MEENTNYLVPTYYKDHIPNEPNSYTDWYHAIIFNSRGKEYILVITISRTRNKTHTKLQFEQGPLITKEFVNEKNRSIFDGASPQILTNNGYHPFGKFPVIQPAEIEYYYDDEGTFTDKDMIFEGNDEDGFSVALSGVKIIYMKDHSRRVLVDTPKLKVDVVFTPIAPESWYGGKPFAKQYYNEETYNVGTEEFGEIEGTVIYDGDVLPIRREESHVLSEHVWIPDFDLKHYRYIDWTWFKCPEAVGLLVAAELTATPDGGLCHRDYGFITLMEDKVPIYTKSVKFTPRDLAFSVPQLRFIPTSYDVEVVTERGVMQLHLKGGPIAHGTRTGAWQPNKVRFGIPGWMLTWHMIPLETSGKFTFNDGRVIELSPGRAVDEPMMLSPIA